MTFVRRGGSRTFACSGIHTSTLTIRSLRYATDVLVDIEYLGGESSRRAGQDGRTPSPQILPTDRDGHILLTSIISFIATCNWRRRCWTTISTSISEAWPGAKCVHGDFVKTSWKPPSSTGREVVSGELYASPEIEVWNRGIILHSSRSCRLPFELLVSECNANHARRSSDEDDEDEQVAIDSMEEENPLLPTTCLSLAGLPTAIAIYGSRVGDLEFGGVWDGGRKADT